MVKKKQGNTRWNCDWSSDVCSSDLPHRRRRAGALAVRRLVLAAAGHRAEDQIGRASCRGRGWMSVVGGWLKKNKGIRDGTVTGVQTCALPIFLTDAGALALSLFVVWFSRQPVTAQKTRSEERRVGEGGGCRWSADG